MCTQLQLAWKYGVDDKAHPDHDVVFKAMIAVSPHLAEAFLLDLSQMKQLDETGCTCNQGKRLVYFTPDEKPIQHHVILAVTTRLQQAGRVRDAAEYAYAQGEYDLAAQLLIKADDAAAATRLVICLEPLPNDGALTELAEEMATRFKDVVWAVILFLLSSTVRMTDRAAHVAKNIAGPTTTERQCVPSLIEFALWRIAEDFTAAPNEYAQLTPLTIGGAAHTHDR